MSGRRPMFPIGVVVLAAMAVGCGASASRGEVTVLAAASLTDAFTEMGDAFSRANPGARVRFNFGPSSGLATQIDQGAPADVFASADEGVMGEVAEDGAVTAAASTFARNSLEIAVPAGNPGGVTGLSDLARDDLLIGLCAEQVPCGRLARRLLSQVDLAAVPDTNEADVRALLTKIEAGELDAGLVYRTDVKVAGDRVQGIETDEDPPVVTSYPIAPLAGSANPHLARAYVDFVLSP
ncbi:MAG: molybdate ABC transporter substrate-binding protein, partial [Acidimicrobiales bacterium]